MLSSKWLWSGLVVLSVAVVIPVACKKAPPGRSGQRTVKASVAEFDPEDMTFDLDKYGSKRVDEYEVQEAFNRTFDGLDKCVTDAKKKNNIPTDKSLDGEVEFQVQLNPENPRPMGVNAKISSAQWNNNRELKDCLRDVVAKAGYPTYDGPPQLAEFSTELDPGGDFVEEDDGWW